MLLQGNYTNITDCANVNVVVVLEAVKLCRVRLFLLHYWECSKRTKQTTIIGLEKWIGEQQKKGSNAKMVGTKVNSFFSSTHHTQKTLEKPFLHISLYLSISFCHFKFQWERQWEKYVYFLATKPKDNFLLLSCCIWYYIWPFSNTLEK